jgi:hypothetical protein
MSLADVSLVTDEAKNLADLLQTVLDRVIETYNSYNMPLPGKRYWNIATPVVDCEQLVVSLIQMYIGAPGDEAAEPRRCNEPRSVVLNVGVSRAVPITEQSGRPPSSDSIQDAAVVCAYDAWILMESIHYFDAWGDPAGFGLGVIATVDADPPEGGFQTTRLTLTVAVP